MNLNEYQEATTHTRGSDSRVIYPGFGIAGEAGEVAEKIKKRIRDFDSDFDDPDFIAAIALEIGDVLWYLAALADDLGLTLEYIAQINLQKTYDRKARGMTGGSGDYR